ncbi:MAG: hypothetical protein EB084_26125, partial [Proteobacteria bacterium]|nr:hypothetical protein [Pseudomonadota bacterium]
MGRRNAAAQRQNTSQRPKLTPVAGSPVPAKGLLKTVAPGRRLQLYSVAVVVALALLRFLGPSISRGRAQQSAGPSSGSSSSVVGRYDLRSQVPYDSAPASEQGARVIVR